MRRTALLLLLASHTLGFARVGLCTPAAHEAMACGEVAVRSSVIDTGTSCQDCGMSDCLDMSACVTPVPALAAIAHLEWAASSFLETAAITIDRPVRVPRPPIRPPPRA